MNQNKIKEQVEFYFSDSNYAKDKFLIETAIKNNKCIPISVILTFQRMKQLNATVESVKEAVQDSKVVEVFEDSLKKIETKEYLEYRMNKTINKRVVHMKGFDAGSSLDDIKNILSEHCDPVRITMRRNQEKAFKGTCFVEFSSEDEAASILNKKIEINNKSEEDNEDSSKKVKREPKYLTIISKDEYLAKKNKGDKKDENFIEKVKNDFIPKLYKYECNEKLTFADIKKIVRNVAFVDGKAKVLRMKYREEWNDNEFESEGNKIKLTKLSEKDAKEYVKDLKIKKVPKKNK